MNIYLVNENWLFSLYWCMGVPSVTTDNCHTLSALQTPIFHLVRLKTMLSCNFIEKGIHVCKIWIDLFGAHKSGNFFYILHAFTIISCWLWYVLFMNISVPQKLPNPLDYCGHHVSFVSHHCIYCATVSWRKVLWSSLTHRMVKLYNIHWVIEYLAVNLSWYKKVGSGVTAFIVKARI